MKKIYPVPNSNIHFLPILKDDESAIILLKVENDKFSSVQVELLGNSTSDFNDFLQENEKFDGKDNFLTYTRTYKMTLLCNFLLENFPFDTQTCVIKVCLAK